MVGVRIGVVMVIGVVMGVVVPMRMAGLGRPAEARQRQCMAVDKCVGLIVVMMRVGVTVGIVVRVQRRPRQAVGLAEGFVAAG